MSAGPSATPPGSLSEPRCAVCGHLIADAPTVGIQGIYGRGVRHADYTVCMDALRDDESYQQHVTDSPSDATGATA